MDRETTIMYLLQNQPQGSIISSYKNHLKLPDAHTDQKAAQLELQDQLKEMKKTQSSII
jgi:hypothetical protein